MGITTAPTVWLALRLLLPRVSRAATFMVIQNRIDRRSP